MQYNSEQTDATLPSASIEQNRLLPAVCWNNFSEHRWERSDGALVKYDEKANYRYAKPWLKKHKGWIAYLPNEEFPISYKVPNSFMKVPIKFASAENAIKRIETVCPYNGG